MIDGQACLPKYKEAVALGLESLKFFVSRTPAHTPTQIPQDIYNSRPLPFIIGETHSQSMQPTGELPNTRHMDVQTGLDLTLLCCACAVSLYLQAPRPFWRAMMWG